LDASDQRPRDIAAANAARLVRRSMMTLVPVEGMVVIDFKQYRTLWRPYVSYFTLGTRPIDHGKANAIRNALRINVNQHQLVGREEPDFRRIWAGRVG
jgi:hypothetical protein